MRRDITNEEFEAYDGLEQITILEELYALKDRIAELERCVVCGGDGKPIAVGDTVWCRSKLTFDVYDFVVLSITQHRTSKTLREEHSGICHFPHDCYSSPDQVPEGGK